MSNKETLYKILRICQEKIVKVRNKPAVKQENIVEVKDFFRWRNNKHGF